MSMHMAPCRGDAWVLEICVELHEQQLVFFRYVISFLFFIGGSPAAKTRSGNHVSEENKLTFVELLLSFFAFLIGADTFDPLSCQTILLRRYSKPMIVGVVHRCRASCNGQAWSTAPRQIRRRFPIGEVSRNELKQKMIETDRQREKHHQKEYLVSFGGFPLAGFLMYSRPHSARQAEVTAAGRLTFARALARSNSFLASDSRFLRLISSFERGG